MRCDMSILSVLPTPLRRLPCGTVLPWKMRSLQDFCMTVPNAWMTTKKIAICEKHNISITEVEKRNPFLLHAKAGSFLAMNKYKVHDSDVINAILNHTTGRPGMSLLEKIIFVADYIEPGRKKAPNLAEIREMAFISLDGAVVKILKDTLDYLKSTPGEIDPMTQKTYDYYCELYNTAVTEKKED